MRFYWRAQGDGANDNPSSPPTWPAVFLLHRSWNDYNYLSLFEVWFCDSAGQWTHIGQTKIINADSMDTILPEDFTELTPKYCSLGQSLEYYRTLVQFAGLEGASEICLALNDLVVRLDLRPAWTSSEGFRKSLVRFSDAEKAFTHAGQIFGSTPIVEEDFKFSFTCLLAGFTEPHRVNFDFSRTNELPHRTVAFVGKNGAGKSGVLAKLAEALSGLNPTAGEFAPGRPAFSRTICASYAVFQPFQVPLLQTSSYRYCGLRDAEGNIDTKGLTRRLLSSIEMIRKLGRMDLWLGVARLSDLLGPAADLFQGESAPHVLQTLSTGQFIVLSLFTDLLANVEQQALFLCDEPESYLHPTLLSTFLRTMHRVLEQFDAFAIVATHSPIVVQEIPAKHVRLFTREGSVPLQVPLARESLGENLSELVEHVFRMNEDDKNFTVILRELSEHSSLEVIEAMFAGRLGLSARLYLKSLQSGG